MSETREQKKLKENWPDLLNAARASHLAYENAKDILNNPEYVTSTKAVMENGLFVDYQPFVSLKRISNDVLSKQDVSHQFGMTDNPNRPNDEYHIEHIQVNNSSAMVFVPTDKTQPVMVAFTGSNDVPDWMHNFKGLPAYSEITNTITHYGFQQLYKMEEPSSALKREAKNADQRLEFHISDQFETVDATKSDQSFHQQVMQYVQSNVAPNQPVIFTGHSMGGALAGMAAIEWAGNPNHPERRQNTKLMTFASASLGLPTARKVEQLIGKDNCYTVCRPHDIVPMALRSAAPGTTLVEKHDRNGQLVYHLEDRTNIFAQLWSKFGDLIRVGKSMEELKDAHSNAGIVVGIQEAGKSDTLPICESMSVWEKIHQAAESFRRALYIGEQQPRPAPPSGILRPGDKINPHR